MNIIVTGYAGHGKDTICELLEHDLKFRSIGSSLRACELFIYDTLKEKYGYSDIKSCFDDRVNHRQEWYELIRDYNNPDKARLGREIFEVAEIYNGIRDLEELRALKSAGLVDFIVWVDAKVRKGTIESEKSMTVSPADCDFILDNNGTPEEVEMGPLKQLVEIIKGKQRRIIEEESNYLYGERWESEFRERSELVLNAMAQSSKHLTGFDIDNQCVLGRVFMGNTAGRFIIDAKGEKATYVFYDVPPQEPGTPITEEKYAKEKIPFFVFHFNNPNSIKVVIDGLTRLHDMMLYKMETIYEKVEEMRRREDEADDSLTEDL